MSGPVFQLGEEFYEAYVADDAPVRIETPDAGVSLPHLEAIALANAIYRELSDSAMDIPAYKEGYEDATRAAEARAKPQRDTSKGSDWVRDLEEAKRIGNRLGYERGVKDVMRGLSRLMATSIDEGGFDLAADDE